MRNALKDLKKFLMYHANLALKIVKHTSSCILAKIGNGGAIAINAI